MDEQSLLKFGIRPLIHEIVRTGVIFPNTPFLVESCIIQDAKPTAAGEPRQGFRLSLADGQYRIAAVVKRKLHKSVLAWDVGRGSVIIVKEYTLNEAKRLHGTGNIVYLAIQDFYVIGHHPLPDLEDPILPERRPEESKPVGSDGQPDETVNHAARYGLQSTSLQTSGKGGQEGSKSITASRAGPLTMEPQAQQEDRIIPRTAEWIRRASIEHHQRCHLMLDVADAERCPPKDDESFEEFCRDNPLSNEGSPCESASFLSLYAIMVGRPLSPFFETPKPVKLSSVTGQHKSRNRDVDILAVIASIDPSTSKPARLSIKRDIRIQDPSVGEPVSVSIFMDPINFHAKVGTVALFRHLTTHDWRRGNLNAYPARVEGREWFIPNPHCLGLREEVCHVETWWRSSQQQQREKTDLDDLSSPHGSEDR